MAEKRIVPANLMAWPRIKNLLPDQKLLIYHLWATADSAAGCWLLDSAGFAAALSLKEEALADALEEFERRELVKMERETGEIFIMDWFRWHTFKNAARRGLLEADALKIRSTALRKLVVNAAKPHLSEKSYSCDLRQDKISKLLLEDVAVQTSDSFDFSLEELMEATRRAQDRQNKPCLPGLLQKVKKRFLESACNAADVEAVRALRAEKTVAEKTKAAELERQARLAALPPGFDAAIVARGAALLVERHVR